MTKTKTYNIPSLKRLPGYLHELRKMRRDGIGNVAGPTLARCLDLDAMVVRKDIEMAGISGSPGVGYKVGELIDGIESFLGWKNTSEVFLAGTGDMGQALLGYEGFEKHGLKIIAAFERDPMPKDTFIRGVPVFGYSEFEHLTRRLKIRMAILCVRDEEAQEIAELMAESGILAIWNLTAQTLQLPDRVIRQNANPAGDLAVLSVRLAERLAELEKNGELEPMETNS